MNIKILSKHWPKILFIFLLVLATIVLGMRSCDSTENFWRKKLYRIARDATWYPLDLLGKERNMLAFSNELLLAIAKNESLKIELLSNSSENLFSGLDNELYDAILSPMLPNQYNNQYYWFSKPFYLLGPVLVVKESLNVNSLQEMEGKAIGVSSGSSLVYNRYPKILITSYDNILTALNDVERNVIDGVILSGLTAYAYTTGLYSGRLKVASAPLTNEGLRLIARKDEESKYLIDKFNEGFEKVKNDGTYDALITKWGLYKIYP